MNWVGALTLISEADGSFVLLKDKTQAKLLVKAWLRETLTEDEGFSVAREDLYQRYLAMCADSHFESTSRSGFGRIVNQAFPNIKSRRLGARSLNKMHYHNMRFVSTTPTEDFPAGSTATPDASSSTSSCDTPVQEHSASPGELSDWSGLSYGPAVLSMAANVESPASPPSSSSSALPELSLWEFLYSPDPTLVGEESQFLSELLDNSYSRAASNLPEWPSLVEGARDDIHPWVAMPISALIDMSAATTAPGCPHHLVALRNAMDHFMWYGDCGLLQNSMEPYLRNALQLNPQDGTIYDCLFALAWWQRFFSHDLRQGNQRCRELLEFTLSHGGASNSYCFVPANELLRSCSRDEAELAAFQNLSPGVEQQLTLMLDQCEQHNGQPTIWMALQQSVAQALRFTLRSVPPNSQEEQTTHAEMLAQLFWNTTSESIMAMCLHELDSRHLLGVALNIARPMSSRYWTICECWCSGAPGSMLG